MPKEDLEFHDRIALDVGLCIDAEIDGAKNQRVAHTLRITGNRGNLQPVGYTTTVGVRFALAVLTAVLDAVRKASIECPLSRSVLSEGGTDCA